jgi:hypothetical protein
VTVLRLQISTPRPYFAELPYALWGDVNYDTEGDCSRPTDRDWHYLELRQRGTDDEVFVVAEDTTFLVRSGDTALAARTATFLHARTNGTWLDAPPATDLDLATAMTRSAWVRDQFPRPELAAFDDDVFWGSWKRVGPMATEYTWVGRWIMTSVLTRDARAVAMTIDWIADGTYNATQSAGLRYALAVLTGESFATDAEWVDWYRTQGGAARFPEPDYDAWFEDLKR